MRKYNWKKILINTCWILAGAGTMVLLGAAMQTKNRKTCTNINIEITGAERHMFIDEKDVLQLLNAAGQVVGTASAALDLRQMERNVEQNPWVSNAEMFIDNNRVLQVRLEERQPVARVFNLQGESFYLDSAGLRLPLSDKLSARVPVFTGFPSNKPVLAHPDSLVLQDLVAIGKYILADSFWMAQVAQVDIIPGGTYELIPVLGDHTIAIGNAEDLQGKFSRLYTFYRKAWIQNGINTYEKLDVQYDKQVVAVRKGTTKALMDSARARALMAAITVPVPVTDTAAVKINPAPAVVKTVPPAAKLDTLKNNKKNQKPLTKKAKTKVTKKTANPKPSVQKPPQAKAVLQKTQPQL
jgi:cell division protein FtsQ